MGSHFEGAKFGGLKWSVHSYSYIPPTRGHMWVDGGGGKRGRLGVCVCVCVYVYVGARGEGQVVHKQYRYES